MNAFDSEVRERKRLCKQCQTQKRMEARASVVSLPSDHLTERQGKRGVVKLWNTN